MNDISIPIPLLNAALAPAKDQGYQVDQWLIQASIPPVILQQPNARISAAQYSHMQSLAIRAMNDELMGFSQSPQRVGTSQALCHWLVTTKNLAQALARINQFYDLLGQGFRVSYSTSASHASLKFAPVVSDEIIAPFAYEHFMFAHHRVLTWLTSHDVPVQAVHLNYSRPTHGSDYRFMFPPAEIQFDRVQSFCELLFDRSLLSLPIKQGQEDLLLFLRRPLFNILMNAYSEQSWTARTRTALQSLLYTRPNLEAVAEHLDIHPKRLRRRLKNEGIEYQDLKDQLRRDIAINALTQSGESIEGIAELTGFAETSTFTRSFKRWTGVTPYTYRRKVGG
ncbi:AraC family transcriptional regulator [Halioxenophilus aromaticivorans]|uniref:AraC family transcriptional regulator n=1 Tax=Halioxenophilus aromaticivorans TaxID=1306992 RepID=A0AAV3TZ41_9ALTE